MFSFEILESGIMGPKKAMVKYGYYAKVPFEVQDVVLTDMKVCDFENKHGCVCIFNNFLYIQHGFIYDLCSGPTFDGLRIFSKKDWFARASCIHDAMCFLWTQEAIFGEEIFDRHLNDDWYYENLLKAGCWKPRAIIHRAAVKAYSSMMRSKYF